MAIIMDEDLSMRSEYTELSATKQIITSRTISYRLDKVRFFNNSIPVKHFVNAPDANNTYKSCESYYRPTEYSPKDTSEIINPKKREVLAREVLEKDARARWRGLEVKALEVAKTSVTFETEDLFYLTICAKATVEKHEPAPA